MQVRSWVRLALAFSLPVAVLSANQIVDSFNAGEPLATNIVWSTITDIGWYYTPSTSYTLTQIETIFNGAGTDRTITFAVFTDLPATGGTLLGSQTFNSALAEGSFAGPTFTGIPLTGGTTYFVALENIDGLGLNQVSFSTAGGVSGPAGSVSPGTEWQDTDSGAQFATEGCSDTTNWFCKPEIEFLQANQSGVPEPNSFLLLGIPVALAFFRSRLRSR